MRTLTTLLAASLAALAGLCLAPTASAQVTARVVASCGSPTYVAGTNNYQTVDTTGKLCGSATSTPSGTQDTNLVSVGGVTLLRGAGATGTGSQRSTVAQDTTTIAGSAPGTLAAPSANILTVQGVTTTSAAINTASAATVQLVAISGSKLIYVTAVDFLAAGTTNVTFEYGTGSLCGTGTTVLTGAYNLTAQVGMSKGNGASPFWIVPAGNALCMVNSAAIQVSGSVSYAQP